MKINKKTYKLWWEFLRRNENYKELCDIVKARRINKTGPSPFYLSNPDKYRHLKHVIPLFMVYGDIHSYTFNEWWAWFKQKVIQDRARPNVELIDDLSKFDSSTLQAGQLLFIVDVAHGKTNDLLKKINNIIVRKRKEASIKKSIVHATRHLQPTTTIKYDALERYLKVYDHRKSGMDWKDIAEHICPNARGEWENIRRALLNDFVKAKKIINFVEHGYFPGPYDQTQARRVKAKIS